MKFLVLLALLGAAAAYTPLTAEEYAYVSGAWNKVKHSEVDILYAVFKAYPDIQAKFPKFAGKNLDEIKGTSDFALHATRIVTFISEVVTLSQNTANNDAIYNKLELFGTDHHNRGVTKDQLTEFRTALTTYLSKHAPWGDNVAAAWNKAFDNVFEVAFTKF
ncbi:hypothetical protein PVAND_017514 [Polypedilum vanderplanki]|uniref:Globin n=1 Tax=Polypedilum vanderplanki TaxID=319348 RepID=S6CDG1_POLVA|nr:hypothetical protein PVAND_017514 [Polypedilum vanderplanki]BAN67575.1 globin [Polypedilum vanderplanki]